MGRIVALHHNYGVFSTEELEGLGQLLIKQLKNRWGDTNTHKRFVVGIDRSKMRLFDAEESAQHDLMNDSPVMNKGAVGQRTGSESDGGGGVLSFKAKQSGKPKFEGFK